MKVFEPNDSFIVPNSSHLPSLRTLIRSMLNLLVLLSFPVQPTSAVSLAVIWAVGFLQNRLDQIYRLRLCRSEHVARLYLRTIIVAFSRWM